MTNKCKGSGEHVHCYASSLHPQLQLTPLIECSAFYQEQPAGEAQELPASWGTTHDRVSRDLTGTNAEQTFVIADGIP